MRYRELLPHRVDGWDLGRIDDSLGRSRLISKLSFVGRLSYALNDDRVVEAFGGLEYENCCWAIRTIARRFLRNDEGEYNNGLFLQLELKGLAGIGNRADEFLDRSIPGYRNEF